MTGPGCGVCPGPSVTRRWSVQRGTRRPLIGDPLEGLDEIQLVLLELFESSHRSLGVLEGLDLTQEGRACLGEELLARFSLELAIDSLDSAQECAHRFVVLRIAHAEGPDLFDQFPCDGHEGLNCKGRARTRGDADSLDPLSSCRYRLHVADEPAPARGVVPAARKWVLRSTRSTAPGEPATGLQPTKSPSILAGMTSIDSLLEIMARLRDPADGCPWDVEQSFETIAPYTIEEAYEVDHAIRQGDMESLCDELGDLLLQVVFHARMAEEVGHFAFPDVVSAICDKLIRRHPHVFGEDGDGTSKRHFRTAQDQTRFWEESKRRERAERAAEHPSLAKRNDPFAGIPVALPALTRAVKLQKRAASEESTRLPEAAGSSRGEEAERRLAAVLELRSPAEGSGDRPDTLRALGRLLAACAELGRELGVDPEQALREVNDDFVEDTRARLGGSGV